MPTLTRNRNLQLTNVSTHSTKHKNPMRKETSLHHLRRPTKISHHQNIWRRKKTLQRKSLLKPVRTHWLTSITAGTSQNWSNLQFKCWWNPHGHCKRRKTPRINRHQLKGSIKWNSIKIIILNSTFKSNRKYKNKTIWSNFVRIVQWNWN